jgi:hypothetical protein
MRLKLLGLLLIAAFSCWWLLPPRTALPIAANSQCQLPLFYRLAAIDSAFDLSPQDAQQQIDTAAQLWNQAAGRTLFIADASNGFPIRFVYDERQQRLLESSLLQRNLQRYDQRITEQQQDFNARLSDFQQRQQHFSAQDQALAADIGSFNQRASQADSAVAAELGREQAALLSRQKEHALQAEQLEAEQQRLQSQQQMLNDMINERNNMLPTEPVGNALAEVGVLEQHGSQRQMTIFAYKDRHSLQLTLLHEFGHALGIGHLDNPTAVMHAALTGQQDQLSPADLAAFEKICPPKY